MIPPAVWPLVAAFVGYPLWWALGLAPFVWVVAAIPMAARLLTSRDQVRLPSGFGLWLLYLAWVLVSASQIDTAGRFIGFGFRFADLSALGDARLVLSEDGVDRIGAVRHGNPVEGDAELLQPRPIGVVDEAVDHVAAAPHVQIEGAALGGRHHRLTVRGVGCRGHLGCTAGPTGGAEQPDRDRDSGNDVVVVGHGRNC